MLWSLSRTSGHYSRRGVSKRVDDDDWERDRPSMGMEARVKTDD